MRAVNLSTIPAPGDARPARGSPGEVRLESLARSHLEALGRYPSVNPVLYGTDRATPLLIRRALRALETLRWRREGDIFAIVSPRHGPVGVCRYDSHPERPGTAEVGYCIARTFRGRGHATSGVGLLLTHVFSRGDIGQVEACCSADNPASLRVLAKLGFIRCPAEPGRPLRHFISAPGCPPCSRSS